MTEREAILKIQDWFENPYIVRRSVHPGISEKAAELARRYGIKRAADAVVLATALEEGVEIVHTFDGEGKNKKGLISLDGKIGDPPLRIEVPRPGKGTLFESS